MKTVRVPVDERIARGIDVLEQRDPISGAGHHTGHGPEPALVRDLDEIRAPSIDHGPAEDGAPEHLPVEPEDVLVEIRLSQTRIGGRAAAREHGDRVGEPARVEGPSRRQREEGSRLGELVEGGVERLVVAAIVRPEDRLGVPLEVPRKTEPGGQGVRPEDGRAGDLAAVDVEPQPRVEGQGGCDPPRVLDVDRGPLVEGADVEPASEESERVEVEAPRARGSVVFVRSSGYYH